MEFIKIRTWWKEYVEKSRRERIQERARMIYQVQEFNGELWFTYNGGLFCPCQMIKYCDSPKDIADVLSDLRILYIEFGNNR